MTVLQGTMQDGTVLPVQVDAQGRLVAVGPFLERLDSNRNVLINGDLKINQRGVTIAAAAVGAYGPDRWKKVDAGNMTQIVEDGNFVPGATYTLSWKGGTPQQLTAPTTGHWTLPNIPIAATNVQLEQGAVATPFEHRPIGAELALCQRYGLRVEQQQNSGGITGSGTATIIARFQFPVTMRAAPTTSFVTAGSWIVGNDYSTNHTASSVSAPTANLTANGGRVQLSGFPTFSGNFFVAGTDAVGTAVLFFSAEL